MSNKTFIINFITSENCNNSNGGRLFEYEARVTTISKSLGLYKVYNIHKLDDEERIALPEIFYLTCYPLNNNKSPQWVDPISLSSSNFIRIIGETIEISNHQLEMA